MSLSNLNMRETEELIAEVKKRPILWNKHVENYNNRPSMHAEWKALATVLKKDKDLVKQKWRNLRDQFLRELKKIKVPDDCKDKPIMDYYWGQWMYFEDLLFLKDYTSEKKKRSTSNDSDGVDEITYEDIKEELFFEEGPTSSPYIEPEEHNPLKDLSIVEPNVEVVVWPQNKNQEEQRQRKRKRETDRLRQSKMFAVETNEDIDIDEDIKEELIFEEKPTSSPYIEPEEHNPLKDLSIVEPNVEVVVWPQNKNQEEQRQRKRKRETDRLRQSKMFAVETNEDIDIDEDLYFVKSLVPFLRKLNPVRKLIVRNEIQSLLIKEILCENCRVNGPQSMCKCDGT